MTSVERTGWTGVVTSLGFGLALTVFGAMEPGYSQATNAVSELGAVGSAHGLAWNLIGFLGTGLLLTGFGIGVGRATGSRAVGLLLALFGLAFAATAVPADMNDFNSPGSVAHIVASQLTLLFWLPALIRLLFVRQAGTSLRVMAAIGLILMVGSIVVRGMDLLPAGATQRLSFAVIFVWAFGFGVVLIRRGRGTSVPA
tara:strand:+ start:1251 stop:1847 length:597 start_codon:yes stop_codon:yes gene_type:complete